MQMSVLKTLTGRILESLSAECSRHFGENLVSVVIYGSVARGTHTFHSDIDLLLIADKLPAGRMNRMRDFSAVEESLYDELQQAEKKGWNVEISPIIRTPSEVAMGGYIYLDMVEDALILYDRGAFFAEFLKKFRTKLENYGAKKRPWKGGYYWEIKPGLRAGEVIEL
jgi:hypothetical protein